MIFQEIIQELMFQIDLIFKELAAMGFIAWQIIQGLFMEMFH